MSTGRQLTSAGLLVIIRSAPTAHGDRGRSAGRRRAAAETAASLPTSRHGRGTAVVSDGSPSVPDDAVVVLRRAH